MLSTINKKSLEIGSTQICDMERGKWADEILQRLIFSIIIKIFVFYIYSMIK